MVIADYTKPRNKCSQYKEALLDWFILDVKNNPEMWEGRTYKAPVVNRPAAVYQYLRTVEVISTPYYSDIIHLIKEPGATTVKIIPDDPDMLEVSISTTDRYNSGIQTKLANLIPLLESIAPTNLK